MLIVSVLSQKGGVGKSTLARLIARTYANADWQVKIADFNLKQKTSVDWAALRTEAKIEPTIAAEAFGSMKSALQQSYDLMVCDGKPDADASTLEIAKSSHLIVIPSGTAVDDLMPQVKFAHELRSKGIEQNSILFVLNQTPDSEAAVRDAKAFIQQAGYKTTANDIPFKTAYQNAQNAGRSISETNYPRLNDKSEKLAQEIVDLLHKLCE